MLLIRILFSFSWPFGWLVFGIKNFSNKKSRIHIFLFILFSSLLLVPYEHGDIVAFSSRMQIFENYDFTAFFNELYKCFLGNGHDGFELFYVTITFFISRFTNDISYAFVLTGIIFYFFWIKIVTLLYKEYLNEGSVNNYLAVILLFCFAIYVIFIRAINGRFYLAYWIFILAAYQVIGYKNYKYLLLALASSFIHQSFIFANLVIWLFFLINPLKKFTFYELLLYILIVVGTIYSEFGLKIISQNLDIFSAEIQNRFSAYLNLDYIQNWQSRERAWFQIYRGPFLFYALVCSIICARFSKKFSFDSKTLTLYYFFLVFWAINSFTYNIASFGARFRNVLIGFGIILLFRIYNLNKPNRIPINLIVFLSAFILYKLVTFRIIAEYIVFWTFSPFSMIMKYISA